MNPFRDLRLEYIWTCPLNGKPTSRRRNAELELTLDMQDSNLFQRPGIWAYKNAHRLENRNENSISGTWGISYLRSIRLFGNLSYQAHPDDAKYEKPTIETLQLAKKERLFCYRRIIDASEAIRMIESKWPVNFACEITTDWYNPPNGDIPSLGNNYEFVASHAFPMIHFDRASQRFVFPNTWGSDWGNHGFGTFPLSDWDKCTITAWDSATIGLKIPQDKSGIVCRGWKFGYEFGDGTHCIEIFDSEQDEHIAWAFCVKRGKYLDVEEFFVAPSERNKGYAKRLAELVSELAAKINLPIRLVVSFADTEDYSIEGANAVARLFDLRLFESNVRWASKLAAADLESREPRNWKPERPASILEHLRPKNEEADGDSRQYNVFYGTDRKPLDPEDCSKGFRNERGHKLYRGSCLIEIPKTHKFGSVGKKWMSILQPAKDKKLRLIGNQPLSGLEFANFAGHLIQKFDGNKCNLLFIHGYRNSFEDAALRAAQLGVDLKIPGATFFYSWPSAAIPHGYGADEATIETSLTYCFQFVLDLLTRFPDVPLHILAHSMGNRLAIALFEKLARESELPGKIGQLIFAAADVDADRFRQAIPEIELLPIRMTSYVSRGDGAIQLSELIHGGYARAGLAPPITCCNGVDTVLVEGFPLFDLEGHGYFAEAAPLLGDIFNLIRHSSHPNDRPNLLVQNQTDIGQEFWTLPIG